MEQIRLQNYRCFEDTGNISLKPITFLLGANSSGKSSFLKFFPLLKQSLGFKRKGTFLWYSTDVDFKDFKNTVRNENGSIYIDFSFVLDNRRFNRYFWNDVEFSKENFVSINTSIKISGKGQDENIDYLSEVKISFYDQNIIIEIAEDNTAAIKINDSIFNENLMTSDVNNAMQLFGRIVEKQDAQFYLGAPCIAYKYFANLIGKKKTDGDRRLFKIEHSFELMSKAATYEMLLTNGVGDTSVETNDMFLLLHINHIIEEINHYLYDFSSNVSYVQPLRVVAERYYRYQNYAIDDIESDGKNMAMYFANLVLLERVWVSTSPAFHRRTEWLF